jgi:hypothetical protein
VPCSNLRNCPYIPRARTVQIDVGLYTKVLRRLIESENLKLNTGDSLLLISFFHFP